MCFPNSQIESYIRFFVLLLKEMQHNSLKSMKKSMKIKEKISIFDINLRLYILHNIQWFKHEPTSGHWFLVRRFYKVRTMIMTLKIVPKKFGSMVFPWHGHDVCYSLSLHEKFTIDGAMLMFSNPGICYLILPSTSLCLYLILSDITMRFHSSGWLPARTWGPSWETIKIQYFRQLLHSTRLRVVHRSKFYIQVFLVR